MNQVSSASASPIRTPPSKVSPPVRKSEQEFDNAAFLATFQDPEFDPVTYAQDQIGRRAGSSSKKDEEDEWTEADQERIELLVSRLSFAYSDMTHQINAIVKENQPRLCSIMAQFAKTGGAIDSLKDQFSDVEKQLVEWRESITQPRDSLVAALESIRSDQHVLDYVQAMTYVVGLLDSILPSGNPLDLADPIAVPDSHIVTAARQLDLFNVWTSKIDFGGISVFDKFVVPHAQGCQSVFYDRCDSMIRQDDLTRAKIGLDSLAIVQKLGLWHKSYRGKVVEQVDALLTEFVRAVDAQGKANISYSDKVMSKFDSVAQLIGKEARYLAELLTIQHVEKCWSKFWNTMHRAVSHQINLHPNATLHMHYLDMYESLSRIEVKAGELSVPKDQLTSSVAPLVPGYLSHFSQTLQQSLSLLLSPASTWKPGTPKLFNLDTLKQFVTQPMLVLCKAVDVKSPVMSLVGTSITETLDSLASNGVLKLKEYTETFTQPQLTKSQAQQLVVVNVLFTVYMTGTQVLAAYENAALAPVRKSLAQFQNHGTSLVDSLLQAIVAAIHGSILRPRLGGSDDDVIVWDKEINSYLQLCNQIFTKLEPGVGIDVLAIWRTVMLGTLLEHVPLAVALSVRSVTALPQFTSAVTNLNFDHVSGGDAGNFNVHKLVLLDLLGCDWSTPFNSNCPEYMHFQTAYRQSPVVVAVLAASVLGKAPLWRTRNLSPREFLVWVLDQVDDFSDARLAVPLYNLVLGVVPQFGCIFQSR